VIQENPSRSVDFPAVTLTLCFVTLMASTIPQLAALLEYNRLVILEGEFWRLFTGHLTHYPGEHLWYNLLALAVLSGLAERYGRRALIEILVCSSLAIPLVLFSFAPEVVVYRGISGILSGLCFYVALRLLGDSMASSCWTTRLWGGAIATGLLVVMAVKLVWEAQTGMPFHDLFAKETFQLVPQAHLAGALMGVAFTLGWLPLPHRR